MPLQEDFAFSKQKYKNPDNDPKGPYLLSDTTLLGNRPLLQYEWNGVLPPPGRFWRFTQEKAKALEADGRIIFSPSGRPQQKRYLNESGKQLRDLLRDLPNRSFETEADFAREIIPRLTQILDYGEQETFYEYGGSRMRADIALADSIESKPWVVIELKNRKPKNIGDWIFQVRRYLNAFDCHMGVVFSPDILILVSEKKEWRFDLQALSSEQANEIVYVLERNLQTPSPPSKVSVHLALVDLIETVEKAETNEKKGKSLENLARFLLENTPSLRCKYQNLQTRSSEIDLVIEYDPLKGTIPLFDEIGRYCLVECKNWSKPVGVGPVRDFMGKLDKCKVKLGIIFSKNGVTGVDSGADALREIQSRFDRDGLFLIVFSLDDLRDIRGGTEFKAALDRKADSLRFDTQEG
ncbi:restriction endonuclease [Variovorax sp. 770b2]|uniref:restriction endonuclease n=1 Tax=Variovorax sp. 770b2 TaxID=1566271 RepID=UPI0008E819F3|nr:restriction endonuclease [Variovorax sp. 770b2]SFQ16861.1 Restriction endonuclease [Variovorax sp. 770b2]